MLGMLTAAWPTVPSHCAFGWQQLSSSLHQVAAGQGVQWLRPRDKRKAMRGNIFGREDLLGEIKGEGGRF